MAEALILKGRVQGVGCRHYCARTARGLGMAGSATNLPDGSVRVVLDTDDPAAVTDYISALTANRFRFIFFGRIRDVERSLWQGRVDGDYVF